MNAISIIMAGFAVIGALDYITGNHLGIGKEFEKGIMFAGTVILAMVGMIVLSGFIGWALDPVFDFINEKTIFDSSIVAGAFLAIDMGGAGLATSIASNATMGWFNGLIVASTLGATISFTLPLVMTTVRKEQIKSVLLGLMCGIITIPVGCFVAGVVSGVSVTHLVIDIIPLAVFSLILAIGLIKAPNACVRIFGIFGKILKIFIVIGLAIAIVEILTGLKIPHMTPAQEAVDIIAQSVAVFAGAFPLIAIISRLLNKPFKKIGNKLGINDVAATAFVGTLATNVTTFEKMKEMDEKGAVLNSAFAVSASFVFAEHLAFTLAYKADFTLGVVVGKLVGGITAVLVAAVLYKLTCKKEAKNKAEQGAGVEGDINKT